jgi:hypothetical protein
MELGWVEVTVGGNAQTTKSRGGDGKDSSS